MIPQTSSSDPYFHNIANKISPKSKEIKNIRKKYPDKFHPANSLCKKIQKKEFSLINFALTVPINFMDNNLKMKEFYKSSRDVKNLTYYEKESIRYVFYNCIFYDKNNKEKDPIFWKSWNYKF